MNINKLIGSTLIIAGTTIGAGMLALPIASATFGFMTSCIIMTIIWAFMAYTALLMIELHQNANKDATLNTLAYNILGRKGQIIAIFSMLFLFYALCAAYISGGGEQIYDKIKEYFDFEIPMQSGAIIFTLIIGLVVSTSTRSVDLLNRVLFMIKIVVLVVMLTFLMPFTSIENLTHMPTQQALVFASLPVIFTSFGFHGSIPSIVRYIGKDIKALRIIMICGSLLPLVVYILWELVSHGILTQQELVQNNSLTSFIKALSFVANNNYMSFLISLFANLALATSFLGVSLGLFDFLQDFLSSSSKKASRVLTALITFVPPLAFALFYPEGFIKALGFAGFALVILALFLPVAMVYKQRKTNLDYEYKVFGGNIGLLVVLLFGSLIVVVQILQMLKIL